MLNYLHEFLYLQAFQKDKVEVVQKDLEESRKLGQALIQSAASGVSTADLEADLESLNNSWSTLNEKVIQPYRLFSLR